MNNDNGHYQIAYLNIDRMVRWKCLSLLARQKSSNNKIFPVAYASTSKNFFPDIFGTNGLKNNINKSPHVLYVVSTPINKNKGIKFPSTLTAKIEAKLAFYGCDIFNWADEGSNDTMLKEPKNKKEDWRNASSILCDEKRAIFLITRFNAMAWYERQTRRKKSVTEEMAWKHTRVIVANHKKSYYFAHVDATNYLEKILGKAEPPKGFGLLLRAPRSINSEDDIKELKKLIRDSANNSVFMSYRWESELQKIEEISTRLLKEKWAIWLDRLVLPTYNKSSPSYKMKMNTSDNPKDKQLEDLLYDAIDNSKLFICLADCNYTKPAEDKKNTDNWAYKEYLYAFKKNNSMQKSIIRVIDLGGASKDLMDSEGFFLNYYENRVKSTKDILNALNKYKLHS